jgi:hypothetical protein
MMCSCCSIPPRALASRAEALHYKCGRLRRASFGVAQGGWAGEALHYKGGRYCHTVVDGAWPARVQQVLTGADVEDIRAFALR